eukprot:COSAG02_NODE_536_length_20657_cov_91.744041_10_plen_83_part_00
MDTAIRSARGKGTDAQFFEGGEAKRGEVRDAAAAADDDDDEEDGRSLARCYSRCYWCCWCCWCCCYGTVTEVGRGVLWRCRF